ncbi:MAG: glycosyltransferase family 2 protein [Thermoguttaceae bacterium]
MTELLPSDVWIAITAYNEQQLIGAVLDDLLRVAKNIVVVDNGSRDDTAGEVFKRPVWLVRHAVNLRHGAALQTGIAFALKRHAEHIITFDADGQHCTSDLPVLIERFTTSDADFALGSRFLGKARGIPWSRKLMLRMAVRSRESFREWP